MTAYIFLFKNFSIDRTVPDFEIWSEKREIHDGKLVELNDGEYVDVCKGEIKPELNAILYNQYRLINNNDIVTKEFLESFLMRIL